MNLSRPLTRNSPFPAHADFRLEVSELVRVERERVGK